MAVRTLLIVSIARKQYPDVHLISFGFKPLKKVLDTVPLSSPLAAPTGFSVNDPVFFFLCELPVRNIQTNAVTLGVTLHVFETFGVCFGVPRFDRTAFKRERFIRNDQGVIHADDSSKTSAGFAGAKR